MKRNQRLEMLDEMRGLLAAASSFHAELKQMVDGFEGEIERMDVVWRALSDDEGQFVPPRATPAPAAAEVKP